MTRAQMARQILYYRKLRFDRRRILYELKRKLGRRWSKSAIAFIDAVLAHGGMPPSSQRDARRAALLDDLAAKFEAKGRGPRRERVERFTELSEAQRCGRRLEARLLRVGFAAAGTRGDVGAWAHGFTWRRTRGLECHATVSVLERRRPYRVVLELLLA